MFRYSFGFVLFVLISLFLFWNVDVIGQIVNFGSLENKMIKGKNNMRLLIELRDQK